MSAVDRQAQSLIETLAALSPKAQKRLLDDLPAKARALLMSTWSAWARPSQLPPPGEWVGWLVSAGRGFGKNRLAAEFITEEVRKGRTKRIGLIARTSADVRDVAVEAPESGLVAVGSTHRFRPTWEPARRRLTWPNGSQAITYTAEEPDVLRGPQHDLLWGDELASWKYPEAWSNALLGLRLGDAPRWLVTTTPKPVPLLIGKATGLLSLAIPVAEWRARLERGEDLGTRIVLTVGSTYENIANLPPAFIEQVVAPYRDTRLGRQELHAEILADNPDALWRRSLLDSLRVPKFPPLRRVIVGVDPATTATEGSAETGIIVAGIGEDGQGYVLHDGSRRGKPNEWASAVVAAYHTHKANQIVAETNNGGDMVIATILTQDQTVPVRKVVASRGKYTRAEPIANLYEKGLIHHVGWFAELEDQMCTWVPGETSPDRLDALVWAFTALMADITQPVFGRDYGIA